MKQSEIRELRLEFGWSQEELAKKSRVSRNKIARAEGRKSLMSIPDLNRIKKAFENGEKIDLLKK